MKTTTEQRKRLDYLADNLVAILPHRTGIAELRQLCTIADSLRTGTMTPKQLSDYVATRKQARYLVDSAWHNDRDSWSLFRLVFDSHFPQ